MLGSGYIDKNLKNFSASPSLTDLGVEGCKEIYIE